MSKEQKPQYFKIVTTKKGDTATMYLWGVIGQDKWWRDDDEAKEERLTDLAVVREVAKLEEQGVKRVNVRINSPGGSSLHGDGIIDAFSNTDMDIHMYAVGICASKAADIFLSVPKENRHMADGAKLMIHCHIGGAYGNAKELRDQADLLDKFDDATIASQAKDLGMSEEDVRSKYYNYEDHWFTAKEALDIGYINDITGDTVSHPDPSKLTAFDWNKVEIPDIKEEAVDIDEKLIAGIWSRIKEYFPAPFNKNSEKQEEMSIEEIKKGIEDGTIDKVELLAILEEGGEDDNVGDLEKRVADQSEEIRLLKSQIEQLGAQPSTPPATPQGEDPQSGTDDGGEDYDKFFKQKAEQNVNPFRGI